MTENKVQKEQLKQSKRKTSLQIWTKFVKIKFQLVFIWTFIDVAGPQAPWTRF